MYEFFNLSYSMIARAIPAAIDQLRKNRVCLADFMHQKFRFLHPVLSVLSTVRAWVRVPRERPIQYRSPHEDERAQPSPLVAIPEKKKGGYPG